MKIATWIVLAGTLLPLAGRGTAAVSGPVVKVSVNDVSLGRIAPDAVDETFVVSADGLRLADAAAAGAQLRMYVDGKPGKPYDSVTKGTGQFSPDGKHFAYVARLGSVDRVVLDGVEGPAFNMILGLVFSPDSAHVAYLASRGKEGPRVVLDGHEGRIYQNMLKPVKFFPDSSRLLYAAQRAAGSWTIVDGIEEGKAYKAINIPVISPDGKRVAYSAQRPDGKWVLVLDGKEQEEGDAEGVLALAFGPDSRRFACAWKRKHQAFVVVDGVPSRQYDTVATVPLFSADGKRVFWVAIRGGKQLLVLDGQETEYDGIGQDTWTFSPDGKRFGAFAMRGKRYVLSLDGKDAYGIGSFYSGERPLFSPDGTHVACRVRPGTNKEHVTLDGVAQPDFAQISSISFSPDGKHLAYVATKSLGSVYLVIDGVAHEKKTYGDTVPEAPLVWDGPTRFHALILFGNSLSRAEVELSKP